MGLAKPGDPKYVAQVLSGLITDEKVLEEERQRRAEPPKPRTPRRQPARPERRWIPIDGQS